jgi:hypothetical protein
MPIDNTTPVVVPAVSAVPELEFDQLWLQSITIEAPNQTEGTINISSVPYSSLSGAFANNNEVINIYTDELWSAVGALSTVAMAMTAIFAATEDLRNWVENQ